MSSPETIVAGTVFDTVAGTAVAARRMLPEKTLDPLQPGMSQEALLRGILERVNNLGSPLQVRSKPTFVSKPIVPEGIGTGAAYADKDAMGTFAVQVQIPREGILMGGKCIDKSVQLLEMDLWLLTEKPAVQSDNSAFALTDQELAYVFEVVAFDDVWYNANVGAVSFKRNMARVYKFDTDQELVTVWCLCQARGAITVATASLPIFYLEVLPN